MTVKYEDKQSSTFVIPAGSTTHQHTITHDLKRMDAPGTSEIRVVPYIINVEVLSVSNESYQPSFIVDYRAAINDGTIIVTARIEQAQGLDLTIETVITCVWQHTIDQ